VAVLEPEDVGAEFDSAFNGFAQSLDMLLPDPKALPYVADGRLARQDPGHRPPRGSGTASWTFPTAARKVRKLIEEAVTRADGIQLLVKQVSLFHAEFDAKLNALKTDEARASEMEHAIRDEIHIKAGRKISASTRRCASGWSRSSKTARPSASTRRRS